MHNQHFNVVLDYDRDNLFDALGLKRLRESYMRPEENSPQERYAYVSKAFASNESHAQRLYDYASKHWLSYSTPILSYGKSKNGLAISCYLSFLPDTSEGLINTLSEVNTLSMLGGGVGIHVGIRGADDKSVGVMPHLKVYDASSLAYKQGTRRGSYATYLDINHPDIIQFLEMRKPTGDQNMRAMNLNHAVNITDDFMQIIEKCMLDPSYDDSWDLVQPNSGKVVETVSAKALWMKILETRIQTGEPYLHFIDTANKALPEFQKALGLSIKGSNLCQEIELPTDENRTAVCCLSSLNLEYYDEWENDPLFIHDVAEMLDNVLEVFIKDAPDSISRAKYSAMQERAIGVGALGFHAYLQKNDVAFESAIAKSINNSIFKHIADELEEANLALGEERGACPDAADVVPARRFSNVSAVAPNASSSLILGNTSPSIEPFRANAYRQDTTSGAFFTRNRFLAKILEDKCKELGTDVEEVWGSIISNDGSVQHLDWLDDHTKEVYKTAMEINQMWIIDLAADRQKHITQGQSVNIFMRPDVNIKYLHAVHFAAWKKGLKGLYYLRSDKLRKADKLSAVVKLKAIESEVDLKSIIEETGCIACE